MMMRMNQVDRSIKHEGHVDTNEAWLNARIFSINTCGFSPSNNKKIETMVEKCQEMGIDIMLLNETNTK